MAKYGQVVDPETGELLAQGDTITQLGEEAGIGSDFNISVDSLTPTPAVNYKTYTEPSVYDVSKIPEITLTAPEQEYQAGSDYAQELNKMLLGESAYTAEQEKAQDIAGKTQTVTDLTNRLNMLKSEQQAIPLSIQQESIGRGRTAGGVAPIETARLRENAIQSLSTSALLQAAQGNLATAQSLVDRAVAQKYDPIKERISVLTANLELIKNSPEYSIAEKNRANELLAEQEAKIKEVEQQETNEKSIKDLALQVAQAGYSANIIDSISNAKDLLEATKIAAKEGFYSVNEKGDLMTIAPGTSIFDPNTGKFIGTAPTKPADPKDSVQVVGGSLLQYNETTGTWSTIYTKPEEGTTVENLSVSEKLKLKEAGYEMDSNGDLNKVSATPQEKIDKSTKVLDAVRELQNSNWSSIVGAVQGKIGETFMTGKQAAALSKLEQLTGLLTLDNMGVMKGVLSDADIKIITSASTALRRSTDENTFKNEMDKIQYAATSILNSDKLNIGQVIDNGDGTYSYKNMDGTVHTGKKGDNWKDDTIPDLDLGFSRVGSDTNKALPKEVVQANAGDEGGQCGRFVNKATGLGLGDSYESKMAKMDSNITSPEPGMVFVMPYLDTGHTGFILAVNNDKGTVTVKDSNYGLDEKVRVHEIPISKITGLRRTNNIA